MPATPHSTDPRAQRAVRADLRRATHAAYNPIIQRVTLRHYGRTSHYSPVPRDWLDAELSRYPHITITQ
jgi:hypothetical protein